MFHPTIFDNLRVVLEGAVYDRDLEGDIDVTGRADVMDMASFQRSYRITFCLGVDAGMPGAPHASVELAASLADIASEQLAEPLVDPIGCTVLVRFHVQVRLVDADCERILAAVHDVWGDRPHVTQFVGARLDEHRGTGWPPAVYENTVTLDFHRKIGEGNIPDVNDLVDHCIRTLIRLRSLLPHE